MSDPEARILAVDDVPANLDVLHQTLEEHGYEVLIAVDGQSALDVAGSARPDLILLDVMMPGIDGYETCRRLKADPALENIPVIFLTARDDTEGVVEGFDAGGIDYVTKPFNRREVLTRIRTHLERARLARELSELNAALEAKVTERTRQLQLKIRELDGRDRIAQHLLSLHTLEETLELVLEVTGQIVDLAGAAVYLTVDDQLKAAAAVGFDSPGKPVPPEQLDQLPLGSEQRRGLEEARKSGRSVTVATPPGSAEPSFAAVPILRDAAVLGVIRLDRALGQPPVADEELLILGSFALQAAVAINDTQVQQDPGEWQDELDEVLEIDEEGRTLGDGTDLAG